MFFPFALQLMHWVLEFLKPYLLHVSGETGKGQLLFTSYKLCFLGVLNRKNVVFTTTNSDNRYIRVKNIKEDKKFRDMYNLHVEFGMPGRGSVHRFQGIRSEELCSIEKIKPGDIKIMRIVDTDGVFILSEKNTV